MIHFHIYFFTLSAVKQLSGWNILNGLYELERFTSLQTKKTPLTSVASIKLFPNAKIPYKNIILIGQFVFQLHTYML